MTNIYVTQQIGYHRLGMTILPRSDPTRPDPPRPVEVTGRLRVTQIAPIPGAGRSRILFDPLRVYLQKCHSRVFACINPFFRSAFLSLLTFFLPSLPHAASLFFFCPAPYAATHQPPSRRPSPTKRREEQT